jgi:hypothetical protein
MTLSLHSKLKITLCPTSTCVLLTLLNVLCQISRCMSTHTSRAILQFEFLDPTKCFSVLSGLCSSNKENGDDLLCARSISSPSKPTGLLFNYLCSLRNAERLVLQINFKVPMICLSGCVRAKKKAALLLYMQYVIQHPLTFLEKSTFSPPCEQ